MSFVIHRQKSRRLIRVELVIEPGQPLSAFEAPTAFRSGHKRKLQTLLLVVTDAAVIVEEPVAAAPTPVSGGDPSPFDFKSLFAKQVAEEDKEIMLIIKVFLNRE